MSTIKNIPILPLRDIVVFPGMVAPLFVGRKQSVNALNNVMTGDKKIFLLAQKDSEVDNPKIENLYKWGTVAKVLQLLKLLPIQAYLPAHFLMNHLKNQLLF